MKFAIVIKTQNFTKNISKRLSLAIDQIDKFIVHQHDHSYKDSLLEEDARNENKAEEEDKEDKKHYLKEHLKSINTHITTLSNKNYQDLDINQPDYILMFMANEPAFKLAVLEDVSLYNKAIDRNIVMVTNSTLFATLKTVAYMWKQDKANKNAIEIARQADTSLQMIDNFYYPRVGDIDQRFADDFVR